MNPRPSVPSLLFRTKAPAGLALDHPSTSLPVPSHLELAGCTEKVVIGESELKVGRAAAEARDSCSMGH